jgi:hypothetical protein
LNTLELVLMPRFPLQNLLLPLPLPLWSPPPLLLLLSPLLLLTPPLLLPHHHCFDAAAAATTTAARTICRKRKRTPCHKTEFIKRAKREPTKLVESGNIEQRESHSTTTSTIPLPLSKW